MQMRKIHHNACRMHVQQMTSLKFNSDGTQKNFSGTVTTSLSVYIFNLDDNDNNIYLVKV